MNIVVNKLVKLIKVKFVLGNGQEIACKKVEETVKPTIRQLTVYNYSYTNYKDLTVDFGINFWDFMQKNKENTSDNLTDNVTRYLNKYGLDKELLIVLNGHKVKVGYLLNTLNLDESKVVLYMLMDGTNLLDTVKKLVDKK